MSLICPSYQGILVVTSESPHPFLVSHGVFLGLGQGDV